jgi:hypothetical protein
MSLRQRKAFKAIAVFLAFAFAQVYIQTGIAGPGATNNPTVPLPQQFVAKLVVKGNGTVTVNGNAAHTGDTVLTGATLETADAAATIDMGPNGTIELDPRSSIQVDFLADGSVRIKLITGCANVKKRGPGEAEMYTTDGDSQKTSRKRRGLGYCFLNGHLGPLTSAAPAAAAGGLSKAAWIAIAIGAGAGTTAIVLATRGRNPSP